MENTKNVFMYDSFEEKKWINKKLFIDEPNVELGNENLKELTIWENDNLVQIQDETPENPEPVYNIYSSSEFVGLKCKPQVIFLDPLVRSESIVLITGSSGVGKTMFTLGLCKSLVNGDKFGNWEVKNKTKVLYVDGELPTSVFKDRVENFSIGDDFKIMSSTENRDTTFSLTDKNFTNFVKEYLIENKIRVCVFDNLSSLSPYLDENSKKEYDPVNQYFLDLRRNGITPIIVHHTGKNKKEQRGTSGRTDNIDIWINLERVETDDETLKVKIHSEKWRYEHPIDNIYFIMDEYTWSCGSSNDRVGITDNERMILTLKNQGKTQTFIKTEVGVSQSFVSQILDKYRDKGVLDENNKLTDKGKELLEIQ